MGRGARLDEGEDRKVRARGRKPAEVGVLEAKQGKDFKKEEEFNCQMPLMGRLRKN